MSRNTRAPMPTMVDRLTRGGTRPHALHKHNPAGAKFLRSRYRAKFGVKASYALALAWYQSLQ